MDFRDLITSFFCMPKINFILSFRHRKNLLYKLQRSGKKLFTFIIFFEKNIMGIFLVLLFTYIIFFLRGEPSKESFFSCYFWKFSCGCLCVDASLSKFPRSINHCISLTSQMSSLDERDFNSLRAMIETGWFIHRRCDILSVWLFTTAK
jgi:hypothetical protein